jgi:MinD superfamily P-loop ATPase
MRIAIASGKGGTGKTTIAVSLAIVAAKQDRTVAYLDCDVEEPNGHIFLKPTIERVVDIEKKIPLVDPLRCVNCGQCADICQFGAIASLPKQTIVFGDLCHACGGCELVCQEDAISETKRRIGVLRIGTAGDIEFVDGTLDVGEAMSPPAIRAVRETPLDADYFILDAPPGTSCPAVETVRGCDMAVLVTEPTPFGLNDLKLAVEMLRVVGVPFGVVINRSDVGDDRVRCYCEVQNIRIWAEIPDERRVAEAYSRGEVIVDAVPEFGHQMEELLCKLETKPKQ